MLCEKPVSLDLAHAHEMIDACERAGVVFQVGHHMRSWAAASLAKTMIDRGDIGDGDLCPLSPSPRLGWRGRGAGVFGSKALSGGGTLLDNGCHLFDLARSLCGDVADIFTRIATLKFRGRGGRHRDLVAGVCLGCDRSG